jgi:hypothetical protein
MLRFTMDNGYGEGFFRGEGYYCVWVQRLTSRSRSGNTAESSQHWVRGQWQLSRLLADHYGWERLILSDRSLLWGGAASCKQYDDKSSGLSRWSAVPLLYLLSRWSAVPLLYCWTQLAVGLLWHWLFHAGLISCVTCTSPPRHASGVQP